MATRSNSATRRNYVSNSTRGIAGAFAKKRLRVQADPLPTEASLQDEFVLPRNPTSKKKNARAASTTIIDGEPMTDISTNLNDASVETMTIEAQTDDLSTQAEVPIKKKRGRSRGLNADKVNEQLGTRIPITVEEAIGRPTGPYAQMIASEIGFIIRNHAPLIVKQWKHATPEVIANLVQRLTTKYDIDMSLPASQRYVHQAFQTCFGNFRTKLNNYFVTFSTKEEALQKRHPEVKSDEEWTFLCNYFSSDEFKERSQKNKINRSRLAYHHKCGSKSFMSRAIQKGEMLGAIDRFESQYKSTTKGWDPKAKELYDQMVLMRTETTKEDGTRTMTDDEICKKVLGAKSGYIKGCGFGPRPTPAKHSQSSVHEMHEKNKALEDKIKAQNEQISALEEKTKKFEEFMANFNNQSLDS